MGVNEYVVRTLGDLGIPVSDGLYQGKATEYLYFVVADDRGGDFGDNRAMGDQYSVQVHYVCPWNVSYRAKRATIREMLEDAGFTYPEIVDLSDNTNKIRHLCFECDIDSDDIPEY